MFLKWFNYKKAKEEKRIRQQNQQRHIHKTVVGSTGVGKGSYQTVSDGGIDDILMREVIRQTVHGEQGRMTRLEEDPERINHPSYYQTIQRNSSHFTPEQSYHDSHHNSYIEHSSSHTHHSQTDSSSYTDNHSSCDSDSSSFSSSSCD